MYVCRCVVHVCLYVCVLMPVWVGMCIVYVCLCVWIDLSMWVYMCGPVWVYVCSPCVTQTCAGVRVSGVVISSTLLSDPDSLMEPGAH